MVNYKLKDYVQLQLRYDVLNAVVGVNEYNNRELILNDMTYADVKFVMKALGTAGTWDSIMVIFGKCFGVAESKLEKWFWNGTVKEFYEARNYIIKEFNRLIKQEQQLLKSIENVDSILWKQAGGDKLNRYGGVIPLNQLGKMYGMFPFELQDKKYIDILILLGLNKELKEVEGRYSKLKQK